MNLKIRIAWYMQMNGSEKSGQSEMKMGSAGMLALILLIAWGLKLRIKRLLGVRFLEK